MKTILLGLLVILMFSCESIPDKSVRMTKSKTFYTFEQDGHEYLAKDNTTYYLYEVMSFTHKGGCKYCSKK